MTINKELIMPIANELYSTTDTGVFEYWDRILSESTDLEYIRNKSISLTAFCVLMDSIKSAHANDIIMLIKSNKKKVVELLQPFIDRDFKTNAPKNEIIDELLSNNTTEAGSSLLYHRLREAISMQLFDIEDNFPTYKIKEGSTTHVAWISPKNDDNVVKDKKSIAQWEVLMAQAITSMDDYTADTFDVISILWMNSAKHSQDFVHFSHEDVLRFRQLQKKKAGNGSESYRKKDRIEVMRRIAALASIWIRTSDDEDDFAIEQSNKDKDFNLSAKFNRLFHIENLQFGEDKKTKEVYGIGECDIKPSQLLASYLYGSKKTTGFLSLKALTYNPVHQKYHKRLTRYLSWQWRIRSKKNDFDKPFNIGGEKGLINAIGLEFNERRPTRTKDTFDSVLDKLAEDKVIGGWTYVDIDESIIGTKGWYENYWTKLQVIIKVPDELKKEFSQSRKEALDYSKIKEFGKMLHSNQNDIIDYEPLQLAWDMNHVQYEVSPEILKGEREKRGLSLNKAAEEIGIAHTTLSRFEKGLIKKPNSKNDERIRIWLYGS